MIQELVSNGHRYNDILEHYTEDELRMFYLACMRRGNEEMERNALAVRVGNHADKKGWSEFTNNIKKAVNNATPTTKKQSEDSKMKVDDFFGSIQNLPKPGQVIETGGKAHKGRGTKTVASDGSGLKMPVPKGEVYKWKDDPKNKGGGSPES